LDISIQFTTHQVMKTKYLSLCFVLCLFGYEALSQKKAANTGIDADVYSNSQAHGGGNSVSGIDDWFYGASGTGQGLIDTSGGAALKTLFQSGPSNLSFGRTGAYLLWKNLNDHLYILGGYQRDNVGIDSTQFTSGAKNGQNLANMATTVSSFGGGGGKSDIVDVFTAFRRDGNSVNDDLWLLGGVAVDGVTGDRFFDFDYFQTQLNYDQVNGFTGVGPDSGHTVWEFTNDSITGVGDLILSCNFDNTGLVEANIRIWCRRADYNSVSPVSFTWGSDFDGVNGSSTFGWASIDTGSGVELVSIIDSTAVMAPPWGSRDGSGNYDSMYMAHQFLEFGINLTSFGIDPKDLPQFSDPCLPIYNSFMARTRASTSFTSALKDFTQPISFDIPNLVDLSVPAADTFGCNGETNDILLVASSTAALLYDDPQWEWTTSNGTIVSTNAKNDSVYVSGSGTYKVTLAKYEGCPADDTDSVTVTADQGKPVASITPTLDSLWSGNGYAVTLNGGDTTASKLITHNTGFGPSGGFSFAWTGPNSFTSSAQDVIAVDSGIFTMIITENRNGCEDTATSAIVILPVELLEFDAELENGKVVINWATASEQNSKHFVVQRSVNGEAWETLSEVEAAGYSYQVRKYAYIDTKPHQGVSYYRLWQVDHDGAYEYTRTIAVENNFKYDVELFPNPLSKGDVINVSALGAETVQIVNQLGAIIYEGEMSKSGILQIPSTGFVPGMYHVKINTGEKFETYSLLILK
jgi:hypothetical protein